MVIQRWQTVLLLIAAVMMGMFSFCSLGQVQTSDFTLDFTCLGFYYEGEPTDGAPSGIAVATWYLFVLSLTSAIVFLIDIFMYKNLRMQKRICLVGLLLTIASASCCCVAGYTAISGHAVSWSSVAFAPFVGIAGSLGAWRLMVSDQNKLRAADRLR